MNEDELRADDLQAAVNDAHLVLDDAGIAPGRGAICNDSSCQTKLGHRVRVLKAERDEARADLHLLKRAVSPSRAGHAPWEGMPDITYFVGVVLRYRERDTRIRTMRVKA